MVITCIRCKEDIELDNIVQLIVGAEGRKEKFFVYCCMGCKRNFKHGDEVLKLEPYGKLFLI